jgi:hypothetical protein
MERFGVLGESQTAKTVWLDSRNCVPSENELFVAELLNWRVQKLILEPAH